MTVLRLRLLAAISSAPLVLVVTVAAAWHTPDYNGWRDTVSRLGSSGHSWAPAVRASFILYGLLVASGVSAIVRGRHHARLGSAALYAFAVAAVVAGLAPKDLPGARHTAASDIHVYATVVGGIALLLAMATIGQSERSRTRRGITAGAAAVIVIGAVVFRLTWGSRYYGAIERLVLAPGMSWVVLAAFWSWPRDDGPDRRPARVIPGHH